MGLAQKTLKILWVVRQGSWIIVIVTRFHCNGVMVVVIVTGYSVITAFSCNGDSNVGCNACNFCKATVIELLQSLKSCLNRRPIGGK